MRCTLARDDIPLLSQWIKNRQVETCRFLAEQKGFEPLRHFHVLRDFESRLFDQLEYCSVQRSIIPRFREKSRCFRRLFCQVHHQRHLLHDGIIVLSAMGSEAIGTVLNSLFGIGKIASAPVTQRIERTVAEQAAEPLGICAGMAGKILASLILNKIVICHKDRSFLYFFFSRIML